MAGGVIHGFVRAFRDAGALGDRDGQKRLVSRWLTRVRANDVSATVQHELQMHQGLFVDLVRLVLLPVLRLADHSLAALFGTGSWLKSIPSRFQNPGSACFFYTLAC